MSEETPLQGVPSAAELISAQEARREKRARRKNLHLVEPGADHGPQAAAADASGAAEATPPREVAPTQKMIDAEMRRMSRETRQHPESSVRAERQARNSAREAVDTDGSVAVELTEPQAGVELEGVAASAIVEPTRPGKANRRRANTADKARRKNTSAPSEENLLLVRQLSLTSQQLNAAHRVIGRLSAERDILRQHFADAVGIPVNEVVIATDTDAAEAVHKKVHVEAKPPSRMEKLNYFGGNDYAQMRRRRQTFVGILLAFVLVLWGLSRAGYWSMPDNISRDSLGTVPIIGDLMTYFLAGWLFFRVAKVSSKGVRWVFPSDSRQRRRR
ncbi:MAG: hypothetical protein U0075_01970 [Thermomicrobiales bacterium]